ncbi:MAG: hypothetical protein ABSB95_09085, partial [Dissulfurispiraceae bacterium]
MGKIWKPELISEYTEMSIVNRLLKKSPSVVVARSLRDEAISNLLFVRKTRLLRFPRNDVNRC